MGGAASNLENGSTTTNVIEREYDDFEFLHHTLTTQVRPRRHLATGCKPPWTTKSECGQTLSLLIAALNTEMAILKKMPELICDLHYKHV